MFSTFKNYPLLMALSEKSDGSCRLRPTNNPEIDGAVGQNRERYLKKLGIEKDSFVSADLVHGNVIGIVTREDAGKVVPSIDGLLTNEKGLFLSITVADCLPVFLYDGNKKVIGLIHAGWRGLASQIMKSAITKLSQEFNSNPKDILAGIGPGIGLCHYEVKEDVSSKFEPIWPDVLIERNGKTFLDLKKTAEIQLIKSGIPKENIEISAECTFCLKDKYYSLRRDNPEILETMMAVLGIKKP